MNECFDCAVTYIMKILVMLQCILNGCFHYTVLFSIIYNSNISIIATKTKVKGIKDNVRPVCTEDMTAFSLAYQVSC